MAIDYLQPWLEEGWIRRSLELMNSFENLLKRPLLQVAGDDSEKARQLFHAPFVVVAHGTEDDPILNYANQIALKLWEVDLPTILQMPSRTTAEPVHRDERAEMLKRTLRDGYIDDYQGIRIAASGRRFHIAEAIVWSVIDAEWDNAGQAATFAHWEMLS
ncbi:MAG: hypothetical protein ACI9G1_003133 [Pirellulaceae bacterium]|jgi:hypothetical protein